MTAPSRKRNWRPLVWCSNCSITPSSRGARHCKRTRSNRFAARREARASRLNDDVACADSVRVTRGGISAVGFSDVSDQADDVGSSTNSKRRRPNPKIQPHVIGNMIKSKQPATFANVHSRAETSEWFSTPNVLDVRGSRHSRMHGTKQIV